MSASRLPLGDRVELDFVPAVPEHMREQVEQLFFFNPRQGLLTDDIRVAVDQYGIPEILHRNGQISISVPENDMQCLFALDQSGEDGQLAAAVMYLRTTHDCLSITHLAVDAGYVNGAAGPNGSIGMRVIEEVRRIGRRINGVNRIELPYKPGRFLEV